MVLNLPRGGGGGGRRRPSPLLFAWRPHLRRRRQILTLLVMMAAAIVSVVSVAMWLTGPTAMNPTPTSSTALREGPPAETPPASKLSNFAEATSLRTEFDDGERLPDDDDGDNVEDPKANVISPLLEGYFTARGLTRPHLLHSVLSTDSLQEVANGNVGNVSREEAQPLPHEGWDLPSSDARSEAMAFHTALQVPVGATLQEHIKSVFGRKGVDRDWDDNEGLIVQRLNATRWSQAANVWVHRVLLRRRRWLDEYRLRILPYGDRLRTAAGLSTRAGGPNGYYTNWPSKYALFNTTAIANSGDHHSPCFATFTVSPSSTKIEAPKAPPPQGNATTATVAGSTTFVRFNELQLAPKSLREFYLEVTFNPDGTRTRSSRHLSARLMNPFTASLDTCLQNCVNYNAGIQPRHHGRLLSPTKHDLLKRCEAVQMYLPTPGGKGVCWLLRVVRPMADIADRSSLLALLSKAKGSLQSQWVPYADSTVKEMSAHAAKATFTPHFWPRQAFTTLINRDLLKGVSSCSHRESNPSDVAYSIVQPWSPGRRALGPNSLNEGEKAVNVWSAVPSTRLPQVGPAAKRAANIRESDPPVLVNMLAARQYVLSRVYPALLTWVRPYDALLYLERPLFMPSNITDLLDDCNTTASDIAAPCDRLRKLAATLQEVVGSRSPLDSPTVVSNLQALVTRGERGVVEALVRPLDCGNHRTASPYLGCTESSGPVRRVLFLPEPKRESIAHGKGGGWKNQHIAFFLGQMQQQRQKYQTAMTPQTKDGNRRPTPTAPATSRPGALSGDTIHAGSTFAHFIHREYLWYMIVDDDTYFIPHNLHHALGSFLLAKRSPHRGGVQGDGPRSLLEEFSTTAQPMTTRSRVSSSTVLMADSIVSESSSNITLPVTLVGRSIVMPLYPGCITASGTCSSVEPAAVAQRASAITGFTMSWGSAFPMSLRYFVRHLYNDLVADPTNQNVIPNYLELLLTAASPSSTLYQKGAIARLMEALHQTWFADFDRAVQMRRDPPPLVAPVLTSADPESAYISQFPASRTIQGKTVAVGFRSAFVHGGGGILANADAMEELGWSTMSAPPARGGTNIHRGAALNISLASGNSDNATQLKKRLTRWYCGIVPSLLPHGDVRLGFCALKRGIPMRRFAGVYYETPESAIRKGYSDKNRGKPGGFVPFPLSFHRVLDVLELDALMDAAGSVGVGENGDPRGDALLGWGAIYDRYDANTSVAALAV